MKPHPAFLARRIVALPAEPATTALVINIAVRAAGVRPNLREWDMTVITVTFIAVGASQQHTRGLSFLFLELECLFQRNLQNTGTVGG